MAIGVKNYDDIDDDEATMEHKMMIQCGVENNLSILGDTLFRLPGRQIFIVNYNIDLTRREIILKGSCSSKTMPRKKALQCTLKFAAEYSIGLRSETGVYEDEDSYDMVYECRKSFFYSNWFFYLYGPSDSESEPDSDESFIRWMSDSDSNVSADDENRKSDSDCSVKLDTSPLSFDVEMFYPQKSV